MLKFILTFVCVFVFVLQSKEDPCTLKTNLKSISSLLHLSYFDQKWQEPQSQATSSDPWGRRFGGCSDIPTKLVCGELVLLQNKNSKMYSLRMMSMARGGWFVQLGSIERLDPLFMLAGRFSTASTAASSWEEEESTSPESSRLKPSTSTCPNLRLSLRYRTVASVTSPCSAPFC